MGYERSGDGGYTGGGGRGGVSDPSGALSGLWVFAGRGGGEGCGLEFAVSEEGGRWGGEGVVV